MISKYLITDYFPCSAMRSSGRRSIKSSLYKLKRWRTCFQIFNNKRPSSLDTCQNCKLLQSKVKTESTSSFSESQLTHRPLPVPGRNKCFLTWKLSFFSPAFISDGWKEQDSYRRCHWIHREVHLGSKCKGWPSYVCPSQGIHPLWSRQSGDAR